VKRGKLLKTGKDHKGYVNEACKNKTRHTTLIGLTLVGDSRAKELRLWLGVFDADIDFQHSLTTDN
jgi:hypothetical protein